MARKLTAKSRIENVKQINATMHQTNDTNLTTTSKKNKHAAITAGIITIICVASSAVTWLLLSSSVTPSLVYAHETQQHDVIEIIIEHSPSDDDAIVPLSTTRISGEISNSSRPHPLYAVSTPSASMSYVSHLRDSAIGITDDIVNEYGDYVTDDERRQLTDIEHDMQHVVSKTQHSELKRKFDAIVDDIEKRKDDEERRKEDEERARKAATADDMNTRSGDSNGDISKLDGEAYGGIDARMDVVTWAGNEAYIDACRKKAESVTDETGWVCVTDVSRCRSIVFHKDDDGEYQVMQTSNTQQGRLIDGVSHSFTGVFRIEFKRRALWRDGVGCNDWWSCFIPCWQSNDRNGHLYQDPSTGLYDNGQGFHAAYGDTPGYEMTGCTGLPPEKAQYIYDNVPTGSTVLVF